MQRTNALAKPRSTWDRAWKRSISQLALYVVIIVLAAVLLFPIYWMFVTSTSTSGKVLSYPPTLVPKLSTLNFSSYVRVIKERPFARWFGTSLFVATLTTAVAMVISVLAGYSLSRFKVPGSTLIGYMLLVCRMLPAALFVIPLYVLFRGVGLLDNPLALVISNTTFIVPFGVWMMKGFFDSIPTELEEAAQVDGCSIIGAIVRVVLPLAAPGLAASIMYCAILSWSEFLFAQTFMSGSEKWTITVGVASFVGEHLISWNDLMAAALLSVVPIMIIFGFLEKYLIQGLTAGAVKS
jgi:multiple sugar transport system permease protein